MIRSSPHLDLGVQPTARRVLLAACHAGCDRAGGDRAVVAVDRALEQYGAPVYVWHEIVHNEYVVESLERKGAVFAERTEKIPKRAMVMFSTPTVHGEATKRRLATIYATWEKTTSAGPEEMRRHRRAEAAEAEKGPVVHPDRGGAR